MQAGATEEWSIATPSELGLSAEPLLSLHEDILQGRYGWIDSLLIIREGRIAFEQYYEHDYRAIYGEEARTPGPLVVNSPGGPYNYFNAFWHPYFKDTQLHSMQSVTKSIVSAAIGIAISRGDFPDLDTPVLSFFDVDKTANVDEKKQTMTLRHLLTMSEGLRWNENVPYIDPTNTFTVMGALPRLGAIYARSANGGCPGHPFQLQQWRKPDLGADIFTIDRYRY